MSKADYYNGVQFNEGETRQDYINRKIGEWRAYYTKSDFSHLIHLFRSFGRAYDRGERA